MQRSEFLSNGNGLDGGYWSEVCACGHAVSRHELLGTEYCRCDSYPGECPCAGGARLAVRVRETAGGVGSRGNTRFFKVPFSVGRDHPLNVAVAKARLNGVELEWATEECDSCGWEFEGDLTAYWANSEGEAQYKGEMLELTGRTLLVCDLCCYELEELHDSR